MYSDIKRTNSVYTLLMMYTIYRQADGKMGKKLSVKLCVLCLYIEYIVCK